MSRQLVVIPAHNEEETIREVVTRSLRHADVSVTDDGSRDRTAEILKGLLKECDEGKHSHRLHVITHLQATHIPKGIQDGLMYAADQNYDFIVTMDAGLSHDPEALPYFFSEPPGIDVVIGSRQNTQNVPLYRKLVSFLARLVVNYSLSGSWFNLTGPGIKDATSGYRRYSRRACLLLTAADLKSQAFDFHMEALALCYREGMTVKEIPISYVFSNSSFNSKVLKQAMKFGLRLMATKARKTR